MERWQENALVEIEVEGTPQCSGVLITERSVLTAKHCMRGALPGSIHVRFEFEYEADEAVHRAPASLLAAHPNLDVMVLELHENPDEPIDVSPLAPAQALPSTFEQGSLAQVGGFGYDLARSGRRSFLVVEVVELGDDQITVSADGLGGACFGDSGGPLLVRADSGHVRTLGVLGSGSASCFGRDSYTRVDTLAEWLGSVARVVAQRDPEEREYQALGYEGRCFGDQAIWFDGRLRTNVCQSGRTCGWNEDAGGYRCLRAGIDPCRRVTDVGICDDGVGVRCARGQLERNPCASCGFSCARSPRTGGPICLPARDMDGGYP